MNRVSLSSGFIGRLIMGHSTLLAAVLAILVAAGCSGSQGTQQAALEEQQKQNEELQQKVDELEKQKQEDVQKQIDALKEEQQAQAETQNEQPQVLIENNENFNGPASAAPEGVVVASPDFNVGAATSEEAAVLDAAIAYYQAAELGDYTYTYNHLSRADQAYYTLDEWMAANTTLDTAAGEFVIYDTYREDEGVYNVGLTVYLADGSSFDRRTYFVWEPGNLKWMHWLTDEEISMFDSVLSASATPTATAEQSSTAAPETCEPSALATRQWEDWVAPSGPFGHPPCQNAEGTYRSYIPLYGGIDDMQNYLNAAEAGDYDTMYSLLAPADQQYYTLNEWRQANEAIGTDQSTYELAGTLVVSDERGASTAGQAIVKITVPTDETVTKYWWFGPASEGGPWLHWLNDEEIKLLDDALGR